MGSPTTENYTGAVLSGTTGQTNRVLTLANTALTLTNGLQVFVNGVYQTITTNFTLSNLTSSSTITFLQARLDADLITVVYYTSGQLPAGSFKYTDANTVYARTGLGTSEVDFTVGNNADIIYDAEAELETLTGRKFTNANSVTEYINGPTKDVLGYNGTKATSIRTSNYPIQSITSFKSVYLDDSTNQSLATLTSVQIAAGTFDTTDYWLDTIQDNIGGSIIPNGKITLKTMEFPTGTQNIVISYTYGYTSVPTAVRALATCLAGIRAWIQFMGGNYNRLDSYSIPQQSVSKGSFYERANQNIQALQAEADRLLDRIGRRTRVLAFSSGGSR